MERVNFQDGTKISSAKVTIDNVDYPVTPARYSGATPLSANVLNTMQNNIEDAIDQNTDNIGGEDYDATSTYEEGDISKHNGQLYVANQDINEPEEWTEAHWTATNVLSSAGGNEVAIGDSSAVTSKTKIWIDTDDETDVFSEVVDSLSGNELDKAPSVHAVKNGIIESGSNANGSYIKYYDGTMICYGEYKNLSATGWETVNLPATFKYAPSITTNFYSDTAQTSTMVMSKLSYITTSTFNVAEVTSSGYIEISIKYIAIGKWK